MCGAEGVPNADTLQLEVVLCEGEGDSLAAAVSLHQGGGEGEGHASRGTSEGCLSAGGQQVRCSAVECSKVLRGVG